MLIHAVYLLVFGGAALACLAGAARAGRIWDAGAGRALRILLLCSAVWAGAYVGLLLSEPRWLQLVFYEGGLVVVFAAVWAWLWFCFAYTGRSLHQTRWARWAAGSLFLLVTASKLTNSLHGLYFTTRLATEPFPHLAVSPEVLYWLSTGLSYALAVVGFFVLLEFLGRVEGGTGILAGLFALAGLPALLTGADYGSPLLLNVPHDSLGVAAFAVGTLFIRSGTLERVGRVGQQEQPAIVVGEDGRIRSANRPALSLAKSLQTSVVEPSQEGRGIVRRPLREVVPGLDEALRDRQVVELNGTNGPRYFRPAESRLGIGSGRLILLTDVTIEEERRRRQQARLRGVAESIPGVVFELDVAERTPLRPEDVTVHFVGERAEQLLGLSPEPDDFFDRFLAQVPAPGRDLLLGSMAEAVQGNARWEAEIPFEPPEGETLWVLAVAESEVRDGQTRLTGVLLDDTERKRAEKALREAKNTAEEAARVKATILSNLNHELRTPLTSIISFSNIIRKKPALAEQFADRILSGGRRLLSTLNTVMDFAETEGQLSNLTPETVDLRVLAQSVVGDMKDEAERKGLSLRTETPGKAARAHLDAHWVERMCVHLLHNAIKFTESGEIVVGVEAGNVGGRGDADGRGDDLAADGASTDHAIVDGASDGASTVEGAPEGVVLWIEDPGDGIAPEHIPDVFREFYQASSGLDRTHEGNGLGLTVVKRLAERMGGSVRIESEPGSGTRVTVWLPTERRSPEGA
ncbi:MAG: ATP-binding protein [Salinibacter sp.]